MPHTTTTMRAIVQPRYGLPEVLRFDEQVRVPQPKRGEVRLRVRASSVNFGDWAMLTGKPRPLRLAFGLLRPRHRIPGMDVAGVVEAIGEGVTRFRPGDEVFGEVRGAYAEQLCAAETLLAHKPRNLDFAQAAAAPIAGITALLGLRDSAKLRPGMRALINGASGGVGTFAVQIAKALGAEVTAVYSARNADQARELGADRVIDYAREDFTADGERYDAIFDVVGNQPLSRCKRALTPEGIYVSSAGKLCRVLGVAIAGLFSRRVTMLVAKPNADDLAQLAALIEAGQVTPALDRRYTLEQAPEALAYFGEGHSRGKSVITIP